MRQQRFSQAADKNKDFILSELRKVLQSGDRVLEVASGTGQHALHFSTHMTDISWQPSDRDLHEYGLTENLKDHPLPNLRAAMELDINSWPDLSTKFDAVYSANCVHVINWQSALNLIRGAAMCLQPNGAFILYGPFKYDDAFTTESNEQFDAFLRNTYSGVGIRDFEAVDECAQREGFSFQCDIAMPANNQLLVWRKVSHSAGS